MTDNYPSLALLAACGLALAPQTVSADALNTKANFNIPPQSVRQALIEFSRQADVQVMGSSDALGELLSSEVKGRLSAKAALNQLLRNTGLGYEEVRRAVVVGAMPTARAANLPQLNQSPEEAKDNALALDPIFVNISDAQPLGKMTVTGSYIRGATPTGQELIVIDRQDIAKSGYATVQDVLRSLPQNFGGGASEDTGTDTNGNVARSSGLNLRGLGAGSTLILLNGLRMAPSGSQSSFVDVSSIPISVISRVEVLLDGASAIYGSDAVGGVVNFVTRDDYEGAETQVHMGSVTRGPLQETNLSQLFGTRWSSGNVTVSYDYYHRDALRAADRAQAADSDLRSLGGSNFSSRSSNPATITIGTQTFAVPRNQNGTSASLIPGVTNYQNLNQNRDLLPERERHSGFVTASQSIGDRVTISTDALFSRQFIDANNSGFPLQLTIPASNPFRVVPPGASGAYRVFYNFEKDLGPRLLSAETETLATSVAAKIKLPAHWELTSSVSYSSQTETQTVHNQVNPAAVNAALADPNPATALNVFGDGSFTNPATLDRIRSTSVFSTDASVTSGSVIANGGLFDLPAGQVQLAIGADYRNQRFDSGSLAPGAAVAVASPEYQRDTTAAFMELLVPVVSERNRITGVERFELSLAGRVDDYTDFGSTINPRIGFEWMPLRQIAVHGNWATSFRAPNLVDLDESSNQSLITVLPDPNSPVGSSSALFWLGGNRDLKPETARTWSAGIKWQADGQSSVDLSYFNIRFEDRIQQAPAVSSFLTDPARFAGIVTLNPGTAQREDVCSRGAFLGNAGLTAGTCVTAPVVAIIDSRFKNIASSTTRGVDLAANWEVASNWGQIMLTGNASYVLDFSEAKTRGTPALSLVDTITYPLRFRMRDGIAWSRDEYGAAAQINYSGSYKDNVSIPNRRVGSWTTLDVHLNYEVDPATEGLFGGCSLTLSVQNVFDTAPPFVNNTTGVGYDRENADLMNRFISLRVQKSW